MENLRKCDFSCSGMDVFIYNLFIIYLFIYFIYPLLFIYVFINLYIYVLFYMMATKKLANTELGTDFKRKI